MDLFREMLSSWENNKKKSVATRTLRHSFVNDSNRRRNISSSRRTAADAKWLARQVKAPAAHAPADDVYSYMCILWKTNTHYGEKSGVTVQYLGE